jgi:hypothetical protein
MPVLIDCPLATTLADRLRAGRDELTGRWLARIAARVALDPNRVFSGGGAKHGSRLR